MKLTVIGCSGGFPTAHSSASSYLVEHDGARLVLDLGNGAFGSLQRHVDLTRPEALAGIALSHCHVDHCADVAVLYVHRHYGPHRPGSRLPLLGPRHAGARLAEIYGMADATELDSEFDVQAYGPDPIEIGPFTLQTVPARHPVEAYSIRVQAGGRSLTYSGDTGPNDDLVELASGSDLALFEATFLRTDRRVDLHLSGADAGRIAQQAGVRTLVLTHGMVWTDSDAVWAEARDQFAGELIRATPGLTIDLDA